MKWWQHVYLLQTCKQNRQLCSGDYKKEARGILEKVVLLSILVTMYVNVPWYYAYWMFQFDNTKVAAPLNQLHRWVLWLSCFLFATYLSLWSFLHLVNIFLLHINNMFTSIVMIAFTWRIAKKKLTDCLEKVVYTIGLACYWKLHNILGLSSSKILGENEKAYHKVSVYWQNWKSQSLLFRGQNIFLLRVESMPLKYIFLACFLLLYHSICSWLIFHLCK